MKPKGQNVRLNHCLFPCTNYSPVKIDQRVFSKIVGVKVKKNKHDSWGKFHVHGTTEVDSFRSWAADPNRELMIRWSHYTKTHLHFWDANCLLQRLILHFFGWIFVNLFIFHPTPPLCHSSVHLLAPSPLAILLKLNTSGHCRMNEWIKFFLKWNLNLWLSNSGNQKVLLTNGAQFSAVPLGGAIAKWSSCPTFQVSFLI